MVKVKCKKCRAEYEIDEKNIDRSLRYLQCPICGETGGNPFYEGEENGR